MKIKHIIMTRFWVMPSNVSKTSLDDDYLDMRLGYLRDNLFASLNNQTNLDFEFILQYHTKHTPEQISRMEAIMNMSNPKFPVKTMVWDKTFHQYVKDLWN